jgi:ribonuclease-3 family protein
MAELTVWKQLKPVMVSPEEVNRISPASWAYVGDAVYELYVRSFYLTPPKRSRTYHQLVVGEVRAESQARHLKTLEPYLTDEELEILRRGRNAAFGKPKRLSAEIYQQGTSLETLIGYLYLTDFPRLTELLELLKLSEENS